MRTHERGSGSSEVFVIIAFVVYFLFMGYLGNAAGYTVPQIGNIGDWNIPYLDRYSVFTGTIDVLIAVINVFGWVLGTLASYMVLVGYGFGGSLPTWLSAFLFTPLAFGMGWLVISLIRGRE